VISLKERAQKAVLWNVGFNLFRDGLQFATMLVLVRLLEPSAYGMFALATSITSFVAILSHNNFLAHSLQPRADAEVDYQLHFSAGLFFQSLAFLVTNAVALILYQFDDYAGVAPLLCVLSLTFSLEWPGELRRKMLERALDWRRLRLLHALGLLLGAILSVAMAATGAGVYALIVAAPLAVVPFVIELFVTGWRPDFRWSWAAYRPSLRFGLLRSGSAFIAAARPLGENAVLVATAGFALTGIYTRAIGLATILVGKFAAQLLFAIYPVLTRLEKGSVRSMHVARLLVRLVAGVMAPVAAVLIVLAEPVVTLLYGERWLEVVRFLPWTAVIVFLGALNQTLNTLLLSNDRADLCALTDAATFALTFCSLGVLLYLDVIAYLATLCAALLLVSTVLVGMVARVARVAARDLLLEVGAPLALCVAAAWLSAWLARHVFGGFLHEAAFLICSLSATASRSGWCCRAS
jgi:O-antigen/teichoic acid export membrane protein